MDIQGLNNVLMPSSTKHEKERPVVAVTIDTTTNVLIDSDKNNNGKLRSSKTRCHFKDCKKKLNLTDTKCRCYNRYCSKHRLPEAHECLYDFKKTRANLCGSEVVKVQKI